MNHRYTLEPYHGRESKTVCPFCRHRRRTFKRYIDTETGQPLADHVGKCDRLDGCGYHYPPREYFAEKPGAIIRQAPYDTRPARQFDTLPRRYVEDTARAYHQNNFVQFLIRCFGAHVALRLADTYKIGTSKHWPGATIFWQIDANDKLRTGKIMLYNTTDGHRVKQPFNHITWAHGIVGSGQLTVGSNANCKPATANFNLMQCLFGEHLLHTDPYKTVAIAESEKTAIIASFFNTQYIWLASGGLEGLNPAKYSVLKGRDVILYPDVNGYDKWRRKARDMRLHLPAASFRVDDTLERIATDEQRAAGIDIADIWLEQLTLEP